MKRIIEAKGTPKAIGPYSLAVVVPSGKALVFSSGSIPLNPETGEVVSAGDIVGQTRQAIENLRGILSEAGAGYSDVVKTTVFLQNMGDFAAMNEVYKEFFGTDCPARSAVGVAGLPKGVLVEIEVIAAIDPPSGSVGFRGQT